ncbi:MAG: hypothetical protein ABIN79_08335 [Marmoricola sp.]
MRTMTCLELGGSCETRLSGKDANEVIKAQDQHLKDRVAAGDQSHVDALKQMQGRWKRPIAGMGWYRQVKRDFAAHPED